jgi:CheY-like chemotaxis protein/anti-sigma regulatory factor (Ser/Thr protein kinase)
VAGDVDRLTQVVTHLVANAIKFSNPDGTVSVASVFRHGRVRLTVTDDGAGISVGFLPHVFSPFKQADSSSARRHGGLGLGLSIVKRLVNLHGGSIKVRSKGPGTGSTFTVDLPTAAPGDPAAEARHQPSGRLAGLRVLAVDDDDDALSLIVALLSREGAHVATASSAREALALCGRFDPDVLLSDLSMPDEDGFWLIEQIRREEARQRAPRRPAAAVTALTLNEDKAKALDAGFDLHVAKPVSPGMLATVVEQLAEGRTSA